MHYLGGHYFLFSFFLADSSSCSIDQKKGSSSYERLLRAYLGLGRIRTDQEKASAILIGQRKTVQSSMSKGQVRSHSSEATAYII